MITEQNSLQIGWAHVNVTPDGPVNLAGQFHMRISKGIHDPVTVTALALSKGPSLEDSVIFVSADRPTFRDNRYEHNTFLKRCHAAIRKLTPEIDPNMVILNATHTHSAPNTTIGQYADVPEGVMTPEEYIEILLDGIAQAVSEAWNSKKDGAIAFGLGTAVVGHNRRATFVDSADSVTPETELNNYVSHMYGNTNDPTFRHIEGYEDHYVDLLYTFDTSENLTGVIINLACPSQETENNMEVSADFWYEVRTEIKKAFGDHVNVITQSSPAGDQSPHRLWQKKG
ncbi:MAG: hypothetical protein GX811_00500, partial [Lentisphaerae bacterium]|nr:hypothetical protein [Lentisphaerota bacterium]